MKKIHLARSKKDLRNHIPFCSLDSDEIEIVLVDKIDRLYTSVMCINCLKKILGLKKYKKIHIIAKSIINLEKRKLRNGVPLTSSIAGSICAQNSQTIVFPRKAL
jgi:hypothetical protein